MRVLLLSMALSGALHAADAMALVRVAHGAEEANQAKTRQYTFVERKSHHNLKENGKAYNETSETYDVVMLEGEPYRRLIERDGQALSEALLQREKENLAKLQQERKAHPAHKEHGTESFGLPYQEIPEYFSCRYLREEVVGGRVTEVVEAVAKPDVQPATPNERNLLAWKVTLWLDRQDKLAARMMGEVVRDGISLHPGSRVTVDRQRLSGGTWMTTKVAISYIVQPPKSKPIRGETITVYSDFKAYRAESAIVP